MRYTEVWRQFFIRFWKETPSFRGGSAPAGLRCSSTRCLRAQSRVQVTVRGTMGSAQSSPGWVLVWVGPAKARLRPLQITASAAMGQGPVPSSCPGPAWLETISQVWPQPEALQPQPQLGGADSHQTPEPQLPPAEAGALPWPDQRKTNPGEATEAVQHPLLRERGTLCCLSMLPSQYAPGSRPSSLRLCTWEWELAALRPGSFRLHPLHLLPVLLDGVLDPGVHHGLSEDPVLGGICHGLAGRESTEAGQGPGAACIGKGVPASDSQRPPGTRPLTLWTGPWPGPGPERHSPAGLPSMLLPQP